MDKYVTRQIPAQIQNRFKALLVKKAVPERYHFHYVKWLRYYLDFCHKYDFKQSDKENLAHFIKKLREKKQTEQQQEQASDAISIYYETGAAHSGENVPFKNKNSYEYKIQLDPAGWSQSSLAASRIMCSGSAGSFMIFRKPGRIRSTPECNSISFGKKNGSMLAKSSSRSALSFKSSAM